MSSKPGAGHPRTPVTDALILKYLDDGGVPNSKVFEVAANFESALKNVSELTTTKLRYIRHPVKHKAIVETFSPAGVASGEQSWMLSESNTYVLQRNALRIIRTIHNVGISEHAVFRLHQRGSPGSDLAHSILDRVTQWCYPLLVTLVGRAARELAPPGTEIAIPYDEGLLLGSLEIHYLKKHQGPSITTFRASHHKERRFVAPFQPSDRSSIFLLSINTYIGKRELFSDQQKIQSALSEFGERFRKPMERMRQSIALGYPDEEVIRIVRAPEFNAIDLNELLNLAEVVRTFFESKEWQQHADAHRRPMQSHTRG